MAEAVAEGQGADDRKVATGRPGLLAIEGELFSRPWGGFIAIVGIKLGPGPPACGRRDQDPVGATAVTAARGAGRKTTLKPKKEASRNKPPRGLLG